MKKSLMTGLSAILIAMLVLPGCQSNPPASSATGGDTTVSSVSSGSKGEADPYAPIDGKEYHFVIAPYQKAPVDENAKMVKYYEEKYGVTFEFLNVDNQNYEEVMGLKFASGEIPDIMGGGINSLETWAKQGVLAELDEEVISKYAPKAYQYSIDASPEVFRIGRIDRKLYGLCEIPLSTAKVRYNPCVWRGDWLAKLGIDKEPETLEEYEAAFYKIANEDPDGNGQKDTYGLSASGLPLIFGAYGMGNYSEGIWIEQDGQLYFTSIMEESKEVITLLNKWYKDGVLDPEFITGENTGGYWALSHTFLNGRIGFTGQGGYAHWCPPVGGATQSGANRLELEKMNPKAAESLVFAKPPTGPDGICGSYGGGQSNPVIGNVINMFGVTLEKEPDRMGKLFQIMDDINWGSELNWITRGKGIEGEDWEFNEDNNPVSIGTAAEDPYYVDRIGAAVNFRFFGPEDFPNSQYKAFNSVDWALENHHDIGILKRGTLPSVVTEAEATYKAELDKMIQETYIDMITGAKPIDYFDTFVEEWRAQGGLEIEADVNEWYKEFWGK